MTSEEIFCHPLACNVCSAIAPPFRSCSSADREGGKAAAAESTTGRSGVAPSPQPGLQTQQQQLPGTEQGRRRRRWRRSPERWRLQWRRSSKGGDAGRKMGPHST